SGTTAASAAAAFLRRRISSTSSIDSATSQASSAAQSVASWGPPPAPPSTPSTPALWPDSEMTAAATSRLAPTWQTPTGWSENMDPDAILAAAGDGDSHDDGEEPDGEAVVWPGSEDTSTAFAPLLSPASLPSPQLPLPADHRKPVSSFRQPLRAVQAGSPPPAAPAPQLPYLDLDLDLAAGCSTGFDTLLGSLDIHSVVPAALAAAGPRAPPPVRRMSICPAEPGDADSLLSPPASQEQSSAAILSLNALHAALPARTPAVPAATSTGLLPSPPLRRPSAPSSERSNSPAPRRLRPILPMPADAADERACPLLVSTVAVGAAGSDGAGRSRPPQLPPRGGVRKRSTGALGVAGLQPRRR
ncbi:hypothetical protein HK405_013568, partial [Cladochytrium tenue]